MIWVLSGIVITFVLLYFIYSKCSKTYELEKNNEIPYTGYPKDYKLYIFDIYSSENIENATVQLESMNYNLQYVWITINEAGVRKAYTDTFSELPMKDGYYIQKENGKMVILNGEIVLWSNVI